MKEREERTESETAV